MTSHTYDEATAEHIYEELPLTLQRFQLLLEALQAELENLGLE